MGKKITLTGFALIIGLLYFFSGYSQNTKNKNTNVPGLVVIISIDHVRTDYLTRYWDKFQQTGFKRLISEGAVCENTTLNLHIQKPASGTATIFTGVYPSIHGIVNDNWYDRLKGKETNCLTDPNNITVGSDSNEGERSASKLLSPTIGDIIKIYTLNRSKVFSVALNDVSAVFSAGHAADGAYWFDTQNGNMISSSYYIDIFPDWIRNFNDKHFAEFYMQRDWTTLLPISTYTESNKDNYLLEKGYYNKWNTFPYNLKKIKDRSGDYKFIKTTPFGNSLITDFSISLIDNEELGEDEYPDLLSITFSSMDYENNSFGPASVEMEDIYLRLDQELSHLLDHLDKNFGKGNVLVILTSGCSASYPVEYLKEEFNMPAGTVSPESTIALLKSFLNITYGQGDYIEFITDQQIYFNRDLIEKRQLSLHDIQTKAAEFINQFEGIKIALPAYVFEMGDYSNSQMAAISWSFNFKRSGDVLFQYEDNWAPVYQFKRTQYTDNAHIPMIWYGNSIKRVTVKEKTDAIDMVPTILDVLNIPVPDHCQGKILSDILWH